MELLTRYFDIQQQIYDYFGYKESWVIIPIADARSYYWAYPEGGDFVRFAETPEKLLSSDGDYYENKIYTQRFLPKWVYRAKQYTMICVDTHTDGNKFLQIFDNFKERQLT